MGGYDWDAGVSTDPKQIADAKDYIKHMLFSIGVAAENGGFDVGQIGYLLNRWLLVGQKIRGSNYKDSIKWVWTMPRKPRPIAAKAKYSQLLVDALKRLEQVAPDAAYSRKTFFHEAETNMIDLVRAFRTELESRKDKKGIEKLELELKQQLARDLSWQ